MRCDMACLAMHLAIANRYLNKHPNENVDDFIKGTLAPDLADNKIDSHFGETKKPTSIREMLEYKMNIVDAAKVNLLDSSFSRAEFLHLITDDIFYRFVYSKELENCTPAQIKQAMYDDFDFVTSYIVNKYKIELPDQIKSLVNVKEGKSQFFTKKDIDSFIEVISCIDLMDAKNAILTDLTTFRSDMIYKIKQPNS